MLLRKILSIFLLLVLLFNMVGYRAWFYYAEKKGDASMENRIEKDQYNGYDLFTISIPLNNPYQLEQTRFERIYGEISFEGKIYKYVKRKVSDGKLILICLPNTQKVMLKKAVTEFGNNTTDLSNTTNHKGSRSETQKNFSGSDYTAQLCSFQLPAISALSPIQNGSGMNTLTDVLMASPGKPPQH